MLGLKRGVVQIIDHQPEWLDMATATISRLKDIFGSLAIDVQHIGSTAIPFIKAKPILDIAVGVKSFHELAPAQRLLESSGFIQSHNRFSDDLLYVIESPDRIRSHQIHILIHDSEQWRNYVDFRDYMNAFPERAREYESLKESLADLCDNNQQAYTDSKGKWMEAVLAEARAYAASLR